VSRRAEPAHASQVRIGRAARCSPSAVDTVLAAHGSEFPGEWYSPSPQLTRWAMATAADGAVSAVNTLAG